MKSIVIELQEMSSDPNIPITELIRKALMVASKLNLSDFKEWIEKEINGYEEVSEIPEYRNVTGEVKAFNPYNDIWIPLLWSDAPEGVYDRKIKQKISEIEYNYKSANGILVVPFPQEQIQFFIKHFEVPSPPYLIINKASLAGILESVKDIILKWSLKLEKEGDDVLFCCSDNGIGISKEDKDKIFTKFYRSEKAISLEANGSGLGLFISKAIIERSGGKIWFESEEGKGSTFCFSLPVE